MPGAPSVEHGVQATMECDIHMVGREELQGLCHSFTSTVGFTSLPILLAHCSKNSLSGSEVTVVVTGKRETHLCLHDRTGLRDPAVAAVPSAPVSAVPSEANLFPV